MEIGQLRVRAGRSRRPLAVVVGILALAACQTYLPPPSTPRPSTPPGQVPPSPSKPAPQPETPPPSSPHVKKFRLSAASSSLVTQARKQSVGGDSVAAAATLERALRIEPRNPLLWIELGRLRLNEHNAAQADSLGRKALALATGDPSAQAAAWSLIAQSLRARGRNQEAAEADERASALLVPLADDYAIPLPPDGDLPGAVEEADEGLGSVGVEDAGEAAVI